MIIAVYKNTSNKTCSLIYDEEREVMSLIGRTRYDVTEVKNMNLSAYMFIANDFKEFIEIDRDQFVIDQEEADYINDWCVCSHKFIDELCRFGYELTYENDDSFWRQKTVKVNL